MAPLTNNSSSAPGCAQAGPDTHVKLKKKKNTGLSRIVLETDCLYLVISIAIAAARDRWGQMPNF